jgi:hypothetical protein
MFVFVVNISMDLYVGYWGIESDVGGGGQGAIRSSAFTWLALFSRESFIGVV